MDACPKKHKPPQIYSYVNKLQWPKIKCETLCFSRLTKQDFNDAYGPYFTHNGSLIYSGKTLIHWQNNMFM